MPGEASRRRRPVLPRSRGMRPPRRGAHAGRAKSEICWSTSLSTVLICTSVCVLGVVASGHDELRGRDDRGGLPCGRFSDQGARMANQTATIETNHGSIELELFTDDAPETVANFAKLANDGFYDGLVFHR